MEINTAHQPFFSVVMPAYNVRDYIGEAIDSILHQSFTDWELIIVDDCSTDGTYDIIQEYAAKNNNIRYFRTEKNSGGCIVPRNLAVEHSIGKHITYLDADDALEPVFLEKFHDEIIKTDADCILCVAPNDERLHKNIIGKEALEYTLPNWQVEAGMCYTKDLYNKEKVYLDGFSGGYVDEILTRLIILFSNRVAFSDAKYYYRYNPVSITKRYDTIIHKVEAAIILKKILSEYFESSSKIMRSANLMIWHEIIVAAHRLGAAKRTGNYLGKSPVNLLRKEFESIDLGCLPPPEGIKDSILTSFGKNAVNMAYWHGFLKGR